MKKEYEDRLRKYELAKHAFWNDTYPSMNFFQKVDYWSGSIHRQMRYNGESGLDPYDVFSREDYEAWKLKEPLIDLIIVKIIDELRLDKDQVEKLIGECF